MTREIDKVGYSTESSHPPITTMALVLKKLYHGYFWLFHEIADPRAQGFLLSSPLVPVGLVALYVYIVKVLGPKWMRNRKPFNIRKIMAIYNVVQVLANIYLIFEVIHFAKNIGRTCVPVDYSRSPSAMDEIGGVRKYFWLKIFDWVDTIFFVLRKSNRQITFLHVYHHGGMVLTVWVALKFVAGGHSLFVGLLNLPVHSVMFTYYLLTTIDSSWKQNYFMKRFLTQIQMFQFLGFIIIYGRTLFDSSCSYPKFVCYVLVIQNVFMLSLFGDFYRKTYMTPRKELKQQQD